jgi:hypothetical protein
MKKIVHVFFIIAIFHTKILHQKPQERKLMPKMYVMDPMERMEQSKYLTGQPPSGNRIETMMGGMMNLVLGNEGAPIYIDQSPSYLYKDPKTEFNQNGVRMPMPDQNQLYRNNHPQMLASNFYRPKDYDASQTIVLPSISDEAVPQRQLQLNVQTIAQQGGTPMNAVNPDGAVIRTNMAKSRPEDMQYELEAAQEFQEMVRENNRQVVVKDLLGQIQRELDDFKIRLGEKDDQVDSLLSRFYELKIT